MAFNWFKKKKKEPFESPVPADSNQDTGPEQPGRDLDIASSPSDNAASAVEDELLEPPSEPVAAPAIPIASSEPDREESQKTELAEPPVQNGSGFFSRLKRGLEKTRKILNTNIEDLFTSSSILDDNMLENLEEMLITSDIGVQTATKIMERVSRQSSQIRSANALKELLRSEFLSLLQSVSQEPAEIPAKPNVIMVVGVNGVGKTTTIGKLAARNTREKKKALVVAADTFRAAAVEQLSIWAERAGVGIIKHNENADPAAVAFDGVSAAVARDVDTVYVDTAGRLHTKSNLMEELKKIKRTISKKLPGAPHEILLVLDATTGQNALMQARQFNEILDVTGIILTKLDGTAKGGIVLSICHSLQIPIKYIGVGESIEDLQIFNPAEFVKALI